MTLQTIHNPIFIRTFQVYGPCTRYNEWLRSISCQQVIQTDVHSSKEWRGKIAMRNMQIVLRISHTILLFPIIKNYSAVCSRHKRNAKSPNFSAAESCKICKNNPLFFIQKQCERIPLSHQVVFTIKFYMEFVSQSYKVTQMKISYWKLSSLVGPFRGHLNNKPVTIFL